MSVGLDLPVEKLKMQQRRCTGKGVWHSPTIYVGRLINVPPFFIPDDLSAASGNNSGVQSIFAKVQPE